MVRFRRLIFYILFCCLCVNHAAHASSLDSLEQVLTIGKLKSSEKAELLNHLANAYAGIDTAKSRMYAVEAIKQAQRIGSKKIETAAYIAMANNYKLVDTMKNRIYALKALRLAQNSKDLEPEEGLAYFTLGNYYLMANQHYLAHIHYKKAEKLVMKHNDTNQLIKIYKNLMLLFGVIEDMDNMMYYADKLLEIAIEHDDHVLELYAQYFIAVARYLNNDGQEALDHYLDLYRKSIQMNTIYSDYIAIDIAYKYINQNRFREALQYLNRTLEAYETGGQHIVISNVYLSIARAYAMLHQADSAEYFLKKGQDCLIKHEGIGLDIHSVRSILESNKGDYRSALENFKKYHHLSDSIAKVGKSSDIARMRNWYELEQKENENILLQQEHQKQKRLIWLLSGTLALILALFGLSVFLYKKISAQNREMKKLHGVKDKLFSVVAHDLRSPMASLITILNLVNNNQMDIEMQAQLMKDISIRVDGTFGLLDNLLRWAKSQMQGIVPAPAYFDAQRASQEVTDSIRSVAESKHIVLNNRIGQQQVYADRDMFTVIVRNLTANAIKYTLAEGEVTLSSELKNNMLVISVKDTGIGMSQEVQDNLFKLSETKSRRGTNNETGAGLGLVLSAEFVKINGGSIWFTSKQGEGSTFFFSVQIKDESKTNK